MTTLTKRLAEDLTAFLREAGVRCKWLHSELDAGVRTVQGYTVEGAVADWLAEPTGPQGSHILSSMLGADALALIPSASGSVRAGERVEIELLRAGAARWA